MAGGTLTDESGDHRAKGPAASGPDAAAAPFVVRHLTGSRRGSEERFAGGPVGIGRGRNNRLALDPELDRTVSARHAEIRAEGAALVLYDLGSLNGTYVNGRRVRRAELADGDEIGLGREGPRLVIQREGAVGAPLPAPRIEPAPPEAARPARRGTAGSRDAAPPPRRSPLATAAIVGGALVVVAALAAIFFEMRGRLDRLERGGSDAPAGAAVRRPATASLAIVGVVDDAGGRARTVSLGAAVHVRRRTAATSDVVAEAAARFLAGRPDGRIEAHSDGDPPSTVIVAGRRGRRDADAPAGIVLLELAHDMGAPAAEPAVGPPPRSLFVRRAFLPDEVATLEEAVGADGRRAEAPAAAPFLRAAFQATEAGAGVFDEAGLLRGIVAGPSRPGLVVAAPQLFAAFDLLETSPAEPLR